MLRNRKGAWVHVFGGGLLLLAAIATLAPLRALAGDGPADVAVRELAKYAEAFPDIRFVRLQGPDDVSRLDVLRALLGDDASNLDYEHGLDARELLVEAQFDRIELMLRWRQPSATFFVTGLHAAMVRPVVCVITLDENHLAANPLAATAFMLGKKHLDALPYVRSRARLDSADFIRFAVNHEVFHCLDTYLHGPRYPVNSTKERMHYFRFRGEFRADLFAALAQRQVAPNDASFLRAIAAYRHLALIDVDASHLTASAVHTALSMPNGEIASLPLDALVRRAAGVAARVLPTRDEFVELVAAATYITSMEADASRKPRINTPTRFKPAKVAELKRKVASAHQLIFGYDDWQGSGSHFVLHPDPM